MLLVEKRVSDRAVNGLTRLALLEALQGRGFVPLIRSTRTYCFSEALAGAGRVKDLERFVVELSESEGDVPYVRGDLFCYEDHALFLIFGDDADETGMRAGVVYEAATENPVGKLEAFCRSVREAYEDVILGGGSENGAAGAGATGGVDAYGAIEWREAEGGATDELGAFAASAGAPPLKGDATGGAEILEDAESRRFLLRLSEAQAEGRTADLLAGSINDPAHAAIVTRLAGAGLVRREVLVSCRKSGRSLFRLPSPEALSIMTASNATCSECGSAVADESAEELVTPTPEAAAMLKGGAWLLGSLRTVLRGFGIPDGDVAMRPAAGETEAQALVGVGGELLLFVLRDGDFTSAHARRALDAEAETHAAHLAVVATGRIHEEARLRLRESARRSLHGGSGFGVLFIEGVETAAAELRPVFESASRKALARELFKLDSSLGFSAGQMLAERFRLTQKPTALTDLAASAAGAMASSLPEI